MLIGSWFIPSQHKSEDATLDTQANDLPALVVDAPSPLETNTTTATSTPSIDNPKSRPLSHDERALLVDLKQLLTQLGWSTIALSALTDGVNGVAAGYNTKQPSIALASLARVFINVPFLIIEPGTMARASFFALSAMFTTGYANKLHNDYNTSGKPQRDFDLKPLINTDALRAITGDNNPTSTRLAKAWLAESGKMLKFVATDQALMMQDVSKSVASKGTHPIDSLKQLKQAILNTASFATKKSDKKPDYLDPSAFNSRLGAMLVYAGSIPIIVMTGDVSQINRLGSALIGSGLLAYNASLFLVGANEKGIENKALMVGIPLQVAGGSFIDTNIGMGISLVGGATISNYFANLAKNTDNNDTKKRAENTAISDEQSA